MKDLFIDAQIANKFATPPNEQYKELILWLLKNDTIAPESNAVLVYSNKLYSEYIGGCSCSQKATSIATIIDTMIKQNRYTKISKKEIDDFQAKYFTPKVWKELRCKRPGSHDPDHIPVVMLSKRKMALSEDDNFLYDIVNFPKFGRHVIFAKSPEDLNYK